ncbi:MAG: hypothetical protein ACI89L_000393 [Phycisphaerales bacterium]|jgi:hypothetical protein
MPSKSTTTRRTQARQAWPIALLGTALVAGCGGRAGSARGPELSPADFRAGPEAQPVALAQAERLQIEPAEPVSAAPFNPGTPVGRQTLSIGPSLIANPLAAPDERITQAYLTAAGAPQPDPTGRPVASPTLIDAKLGDINGKPIFAGEFFETLEAAFEAEAERMSRATWLQFVRSTITQQLDGMITDELLRAEALARLTPEQQQGLRAFLNKTRDGFLSKNLGSERLAEEQARSERGKSLDDVLREERESILISIEIRESINRRVNVSWRDVQQRYLRDFDDWNPDPIAVFRLIRVMASDTDTVAAVNGRLGAGEDFKALATEDFNGFNTDTEGVQRTPFAGDFTGGSFFGPAALNEAAQQLKPGEWTGPIEFSGLVFWLRLESIDEQSTSLYDAQMTIETQLLSQRRRAELDRYIRRLVDRARVGNREQIIESLYDIAVDRYGVRE